jgi:hypothetical protein
MTLARSLAVTLISAFLLAGPGVGSFARPVAAAGPEGQATGAVRISLAPTWFDPAPCEDLRLARP